MTKPGWLTVHATLETIRNDAFAKERTSLVRLCDDNYCAAMLLDDFSFHPSLSHLFDSAGLIHAEQKRRQEGIRRSFQNQALAQYSHRRISISKFRDVNRTRCGLACYTFFCTQFSALDWKRTIKGVSACVQNLCMCTPCLASLPNEHITVARTHVACITQATHAAQLVIRETGTMMNGTSEEPGPLCSAGCAPSGSSISAFRDANHAGSTLACYTLFCTQFQLLREKNRQEHFGVCANKPRTSALLPVSFFPKNNARCYQCKRRTRQYIPLPAPESERRISPVISCLVRSSSLMRARQEITHEGLVSDSGGGRRSRLADARETGDHP